jgi:hypothetical protein
MSDHKAMKAEALAALTIACMSALDEGTTLASFLALIRAAHALGVTSEEGNTDTVVLAVAVAAEADVSLADLLDTAAITWEEIEAERASGGSSDEDDEEEEDEDEDGDEDDEDEGEEDD